MILIQSLMGQSSVNYWIFSTNSITIIKTQTDFNTILATETTNINNNTFNYNNSVIFVKPDVFASYPQGDKVYFKLMKNQLKTVSPNRLIVTACIVISNTGKIEDIGITKSCGEFEYDLKAVNFLRTLGLWTPASHQGSSVSSLLYLPVIFYPL